MIGCDTFLTQWKESFQRRTMRRGIITVAILLALAVLGYFGYRRYQQTQAALGSQYQTVELSRGDLTASVGATGTVRANQTAILTWQLTGQIAEVGVEVGDLVQPDQPLASLDEKSLPQNVILARADLVTARRQLDQLLNSDVARAQANQTLVAAQKELEDAKEKRESKNYARALPATVDEARANLVVAEDAVKRATELYDKVDDRGEDDPVRAEAFAQLAAARKNRDRQLANLNWLLGRPDNIEVAEADARVMLAEANLKDAQLEYARLQNGSDPQDVEAAQARIAGLEAVLDTIRLEAPIGGTITEVSIKPGDQVAPTSPAFRIDDLSHLLVDVLITEVDINRIRVGQPATMTFDAISDNEFGGKVTQVARVGIPTNGVVNFTVTIELNNQEGIVRPGMTAAVNIITDLVEDVLVVPNRAVRLRDGKRVVYVLRDGVPVMTEIQLGLTSDVQSELVNGGVKAGDLLVLNPPAQPFQGAGGPPSGVRDGGD
jgi:HlyD family secretion protein